MMFEQVKPNPLKRAADILVVLFVTFILTMFGRSD